MKFAMLEKFEVGVIVAVVLVGFLMPQEGPFVN